MRDSHMPQCTMLDAAITQSRISQNAQSNIHIDRPLVTDITASARRFGAFMPDSCTRLMLHGSRGSQDRALDAALDAPTCRALE